MTNDIVIVGSGMAGYTLAREIRKIDKIVPITIVTGDDGSVYSKPMLSNAFAQGKSPSDLVQKTAEVFAVDQNITVRPHTRVDSIDRTNKGIGVTTPEGQSTMSYGRLALALGARPRRYAAPNGFRFPTVNSLNDYKNWRADLRKHDHVLIVGAGLIGVEFANDLVTGGHAVTIVEPAPHPLGRLLPPELGSALNNALNKVGIAVKLGTSIRRIETDSPRPVAVLDSGERFAFDKGLAAIGLAPNIDLAHAAGLSVGMGITIDATLRTNDANIFALGDCAETPAGVLPFVLPLMAEARALARTLTGTETALQLPALPVTVKTPALPLVVCPPPATTDGTWTVTKTEKGHRATFTGLDGSIRGFALSGEATTERMALAKAVPPLLAA